MVRLDLPPKIDYNYSFLNTMLIEFSVSNYRSISDEQILSLVPSEQQEYLNNIIEK
ncbi:hypothetical protein THIOM_005622, partial [Candidatus Thiomargarita nelsonii]